MRNVPADSRFEGPCTDCEFKGHCEVYDELRNNVYEKTTWRSSPTPTVHEVAIGNMTDNWLEALESLYRKNPEWRRTHPPGVALAALFDYATSAFYANELLNAQLEIRLDGVFCEGKVHFPYVWMCPSCVARSSSHRDAIRAYLPGAAPQIEGERRLYPDDTKLGKPGGRFIGDVGIVVMETIVSRILRRLRPGMVIKRAGGEAGEFDLLLADTEILAMVEVKAKPMLCYPLVVEFAKSSYHQQHAWISVPRARIGRIGLNLASTNTVLPLTVPDGPNWPFPDFVSLARDTDSVRAVVENWHGHLKGYRLWGDAEPSKTRWLRFGCGNLPDVVDGQRWEKRVSNTKILPGLDRTDDLKKGSSQVIGYGAKYKLGCERRALRSVLMGNVFAETHRAALDHIFGLRIARALTTKRQTEPDRWEFVVDAAVGFTSNVFYQPGIKDWLDPDLLFPQLP